MFSSNILKFYLLIIIYAIFCKIYQLNARQHFKNHSVLTNISTNLQVINGHKFCGNNVDKDTIVIGFLAEYSQMRVTLGGLPLAVEAINKDPTLLPGKRLVFKAFDVGPKTGVYRVQTIR
uniref:Uncharacterized protein n=1 Tax=Glossina brevipalpis TaxID=37001 RepID=A0A1A9W0S8_9MUSC